MGRMFGSEIRMWLPKPQAATLVVSASNSLFRERADYVCDGVADQVEIQAALNALPATGGEVKLLDGTYNITATINLDTNQTLKGCGRNTILTTLTHGLIFLSVIGAGGAELTGIVIADLQVDGAGTADAGILLNYADYSLVQNVYAHHFTDSDNYAAGIALDNSDFNIITGNICRANYYNGIVLYTSSSNNTISSNICQGTTNGSGIGMLTDCNGNTIVGNTCQGGGYQGISLGSRCNGNTIVGNICRGNGRDGILISSSLAANPCTNNNITGNICEANSQVADATYDNIRLYRVDYNLISANVCHRGVGANQPRYGINVSDVACDKNIIQGNDLHDAGKTANFNDAGTCTIVQDDNREIEITQVRHYAYVKNTSGGALVAGDVVVLKAAAAGNEITTTTTEGDQRAFGMVAEAIADNASGYIQILGKTTALKVNGVVDIAIGDLIGCFTTAKIGMKAASGKMAFAIALEAYIGDDSNGVIDALIIVPRQAV